MRIATVLVGLADLAERACARPRPILLLVLCILRPAEAIARQFAIETARAAALPAPVHALVFAQALDPAPDGTTEDRAEAFRLAMAFRLLAAVLGALAKAGAAPRGSRPYRRPEAHALRFRSRAKSASARIDTS